MSARSPHHRKDWQTGSLPKGNKPGTISPSASSTLRFLSPISITQLPPWSCLRTVPGISSKTTARPQAEGRVKKDLPLPRLYESVGLSCIVPRCLHVQDLVAVAARARIVWSCFAAGAVVCCRCSNQSGDVEARYFPIRPVLAEIDFRLLQIGNYGDTEVCSDLVAE